MVYNLTPVTGVTINIDSPKDSNFPGHNKLEKYIPQSILRDSAEAKNRSPTPRPTTNEGTSSVNPESF